MNRTQMVEAIARTLQTADDKDQGRRLVLVQCGGDWRIGYQIPSYTGAWSEGMQPAAWMVHDWLTVGDSREPSTSWDLESFLKVAMEIRTAALDAAGPLPAGVDLLVVISPAQALAVVV
jgi:hypothetical protein